MKCNCLILLTAWMVYISCSPRLPAPSSEEWVQLFNKKDLSGWDVKIAHHELNENFNNSFLVKDSLLRVDYSGFKQFDGQFGHLYYEKPFSYYKVRIEYRFFGTQLAGAPEWGNLNSGIMLHSQSAETVGRDQSFPVSLEMQFLASDSTLKRPTGNLCTPGTEVWMKSDKVQDHCIDASSGQYPVGEWVTAEAVVLGDSIIYHIINGDTVLTYHKPVIGGGFVNQTLSWSSGGFGADSTSWIRQQGRPLSTGYIALQAESQPLEFRTVVLLNLEGCMDKSAINYKSYFIKGNKDSCRYR
jgi:Domain of Unknown Function (DUF1080)